MKKQRHTEEQIIQVLHEAGAGAAIDEHCRRHGVSQAGVRNTTVCALTAPLAASLQTLSPRPPSPTPHNFPQLSSGLIFGGKLKLSTLCHMQSCILCQSRPSIENSHIFPLFVVRRLKRGTPHGTLRNSNDLKRPAQDGWKTDYLCGDCEDIFEKWEDWFCREVYDPFLSGTRTVFPVSEKPSLFAASVHFRLIRYILDQRPDAVVPRDLADLYALLQHMCLYQTVPATGFHAYLEFLQPITDLASGYPPGVNAYISDALDGRLFDWCVPGQPPRWVSYAKFQSMILFCTSAELDVRGSGVLDKTRIGITGTLDSTAQGNHLLGVMKEDFIRRAGEIQAGYAVIPPKQHAKNVAKIQTAPNIADYRAHKAFVADQMLLAQWNIQHPEAYLQPTPLPAKSGTSAEAIVDLPAKAKPR